MHPSHTKVEIAVMGECSRLGVIISDLNSVMVSFYDRAGGVGFFGEF